jgi:hypothetical protein
MAAQNPGRIDVHIHPDIRARVAREALARGVTLNDVINERLALSYGLDPARYPIPRKPPGRKLAVPEGNGQPQTKGPAAGQAGKRRK